MAFTDLKNPRRFASPSARYLAGENYSAVLARHEVMARSKTAATDFSVLKVAITKTTRSPCHAFQGFRLKALAITNSVLPPPMSTQPAAGFEKECGQTPGKSVALPHVPAITLPK